MHFPKSRSAFTLIELLVVIAIIAILSVVVILTLNPAELLRQSRDSNRLSDMATINQAVGIYAEDVGGNTGSSNMIYVSIPDPLATSTAGDQCQGLNLPSISTSSQYSYHCSASSTYRNVDSNGWIPINFKAISSGSPLGNLSVDPVNNSSTRLYYAYTSDTKQYEITAAMESQKYKLGGSNDAVSNDGGSKISLLEKGTNLNLDPLDYGDTSLIGYWPMDEGTGTVAYDMAGSVSSGTWSGTKDGTSGYYSAGKVGTFAGHFDGSTNYIISNLFSTITRMGTYSFSAWIYPTNINPADHANIFENSLGSGDRNGMSIYSNNIRFGYYNGSTWVGASGPITANTWSYVVGVDTDGTVKIYINGVLQSGTANPYAYYGDGGMLLGFSPGSGIYFTGLLDDVRVYNRALSSAEIQAIYNGEK